MGFNAAYQDTVLYSALIGCIEKKVRANPLWFMIYASTIFTTDDYGDFNSQRVTTYYIRYD